MNKNLIYFEPVDSKKAFDRVITLCGLRVKNLPMSGDQEVQVMYFNVPG